MHRFICTDCTRTFQAAGTCPSCPDEPLLDLENEDVRLMLQDEDDRVARTRHYSFVIAAGLAGFLLSLVAMVVVGPWLYDNDLPMELAFLPTLLVGSLGEVAYRLSPAKRVLPAS
jgi:hypothetical protein